MAYRVYWTTDADSYLGKMDEADQRKVRRGVALLAEDPYSEFSWDGKTPQERVAGVTGTILLRYYVADDLLFILVIDVIKAPMFPDEETT